MKSYHILNCDNQQKIADSLYGYYTGIHKDAPPVIAKINFPVLNTEDTYNVWYDEWGNEIDRTECTTPLVLRSDINHTVEIGANAKYPRLQFSFCFYNEPLHLLK